MIQYRIGIWFAFMMNVELYYIYKICYNKTIIEKDIKILDFI